MTAKWIPSTERSRFVSAYLGKAGHKIRLIIFFFFFNILTQIIRKSFIYFFPTGSSVGAAITYPLCATVSNALGWEAAFYVTSVLGVIW